MGSMKSGDSGNTVVAVAVVEGEGGIADASVLVESVVRSSAARWCESDQALEISEECFQTTAGFFGGFSVHFGGAAGVLRLPQCGLVGLCSFIGACKRKFWSEQQRCVETSSLNAHSTVCFGRLSPAVSIFLRKVFRVFMHETRTIPTIIRNVGKNDQEVLSSSLCHHTRTPVDSLRHSP